MNKENDSNNPFDLQGFLSRQLSLLLIEDNPGDKDLVRIGLKQDEDFKSEISWAQTLSEGLEMLKKASFDCILLDLSLPDTQEMNGLEAVSEAFPQNPIVVLTGNYGRDWGIRAIQMGAQEFLNKNDDLNSFALVRAIRYSMLRKKYEERMRELLIKNQSLEKEVERLEQLLEIKKQRETSR